MCKSALQHGAACHRQPVHLIRYVHVLSHKLMLKAKALHARILYNLDHVREKLSAFAWA